METNVSSWNISHFFNQNELFVTKSKSDWNEPKNLPNVNVSDAISFILLWKHFPSNVDENRKLIFYDHTIVKLLHMWIHKDCEWNVKWGLSRHTLFICNTNIYLQRFTVSDMILNRREHRLINIYDRKWVLWKMCVLYTYSPFTTNESPVYIAEKW